MSNLSQMTDEELAMQYVQGNNKAFDLLLSRNQSKLFSYILFVVHDQDVANDIFQETFVKVVMKLQQGRYTPSGKFGAWVMRIAHNVIMDWYRDQRIDRMVEVAKDNDLSNISSHEVLQDSIENDFVRLQVLSDVKKMMNNLPAPQREVVYMRFFQGMSFKEIAETTEVSINTSLGRMRYAILNLRRMAKAHNIALQIA
ncbi:MAG: sigma-70 family RNA polymerase sigma factor [Prevotella sp.]|jgi:RNA polymerase sigma-70 factor (ECF subfamily)|nr:sigma-70 family RNA polymerase sigma factor [Prevotella sp.]MBP3745518.1 sigma-70 family RNA polymerase sigma factor [Prevotella sp.]MBQ2060407.1 sigma-70 family RNA polymerase sigma factor [Prevotella sp.]MBQ2338008.1 sigma-70 family RNA polymerase sigma factor [Prevotella sp.]MBQ6422060.1 sigma-70 family RNA polymerase sigma factor [Prevotella sp.]